MIKPEVFDFRAHISAAIVGIGAALAVVVLGGSVIAMAASSAPASRCLSQNLGISLGQGSGTAGSTYYPLYFKNNTNGYCTLYGYPGVSALRNGSQLGASAVWEASVAERTVLLGPGQYTTAYLQVTNVGNFPISACKPETASQLKVYAPGAYDAKVIPASLTGCSVPSTVWMHAEVVR